MLPVGEHVMASRRHSSFVLSRTGIEPGFRVKPRLRFIDTATLVARLLGFPVAVILWFNFGFRVAARFGDTWFIVALFGLLLALCFAVDQMLVFALRVIFRSSGYMTSEEAQHFPLNVSKRSADPWPFDWLEQIKSK